MWGNEDFGGSSQSGGRRGGGFVPGDGKYGSPAGGAAASRVKRTQNIFSVTVKQLMDSPEETLRILDTEVSVVSIVGLVKTVETTSTKISYIIDDSTGTIEAHTYMGTDDDSMGAPLVLTENTYGKVIGSVRTTKGGGSSNAKYIIIFKAMPVMDLNEITTHGLEVLRIPMKMRKLQESQSMKAGLGTVETSLTNSLMGVSFGESSAMNTSNAVNSSAGGQNVSGLSSNQNMVFRCIQSVKGDEGVHVEQVVTNLKNKMSAKDVMAAIEFLSGEGHIYSTLDDEHYKCTDW